MRIGKEIGPFRIDRELGSGAMGTVYRAVYRETGQFVALKMILFGLANDEKSLARFEREAAILKQLKHPNIVRLFATGRYKKKPFIAMEYIEGETLEEVLARRGRLSWEDVVAIGKQLAAALHHAHQCGIIHRDLKPSNLMILKDGTLKLTDFGIAKDVDVTALTGANHTVGTAAYMSPEQCRGEKTITSKSDLYSLGVVFYELLCGEKPFIADSPLEIFLAHAEKPAPRVARRALDVPPSLDILIHQLMEKKPEHRPRDAEMVAQALDEVVQKAIDLKSAGVDAVTARKIDRTSAAIRIDESDQQIARELRGAVLKKKVRRVERSLTDSPWFPVVFGGVILFVTIIGISWMVAPPSASSLYQRIKAAHESGNTERADELIQQFFTNYPSLKTEESEQLREWADGYTAAAKERVLHNRLRKKLTADGPWQELAYSAARAELEGELSTARLVWNEIIAKASGSTEGSEWACLAKKRLKNIDELPLSEQKLNDILDAGLATTQDLERQCAEAMRAERFGDLPTARDRWLKIRDESPNDLARRPWTMLAAVHYREMRANSPTTLDAEKQFRRSLVRSRLAEIDEKLRVPDGIRIADSRRIARDMLILYSEDPDPELKSAAAQAASKVRDVRTP